MASSNCTTLNGLRANDILRNSQYSGLSVLQTTRADDRCFGVQSGNEGLLKLVNRGINVLGADYAQNLAFRYTNQLYSYSFTDMLRKNMAIFASIILAVAALIILFLVRDIRRSKREIQNKEIARKKLEKANAELEESQRAKQKELEDRLALQEELLEQQKRREQQDKMITALASDYRSVYHVDLDRENMNYFIEGLQGSGKSTLVRKLSERHSDYTAVREGEYSPVELSWCAYMNETAYHGILEVNHSNYN